MIKIKEGKTAMIILAAGRSDRMGDIKQNLPWKHTTLLGHVIQQGLVSDINEVLIVVGANEKSILNKISINGVTVVRNNNWERGMGSSIACAMHDIMNRSIQYDAVLIGLTDQPLIDSTHYNNLIYRFFNSKKTIIATQINNRVGVPAIFAPKHFSALSKLDKDYGARKIINMKLEETEMIEIANKGIDIDTREAYKKLYNKFGSDKDSLR